MGKGGAPEKEDVPMDKRLQWMEQRINAALKLKPADSKKLLDNEENRSQMTEFLDLADTRHVYIYPTANGFVAKIDPPEEIKKKGIYFSKTKREKLSDEASLRENVTFGDLVPDTLNALNVLTRKVFAPIIQKEKTNVQSVPDVVLSELREDTSTLLSQMLVTLGLSHNKTLLPMPAVELPARVEEANFDKDLVYQLEGAVVAWTAQIRSAIASSPEELDTEAQRIGAAHPGPLDEVAFWQEKSENLANIEEQLYSMPALKMLVILKRSESSYYPQLEQLFADVKEAAFEARDNYRYLQPITAEFALLCPSSSTRVEFDNLVARGVFRRLFHCLYLLWTKSTFFNRPSRMVVLIRELCNDLIARAAENINVSEFAEDFERKDAIERIGITLAVCSEFKAVYFRYKSKIMDNPNPWKFQNQALFAKLDIFLERCNDILDIIETGVLYEKLETMKVGGVHGQLLITQIEIVKADFDTAFKRFFSVPYDLLNVDEPRFDTDYATFRATVRDLEQRLGAVLAATLDECGAISEVFKAVDTFEGFTERPAVQQEWQKKQMDVLKSVHDDLLDVNDQFTKDDANDNVMYPNMPPVATTLVWCKALLARLDESHGRVHDLSEAVQESELGRETQSMYLRIRDALTTHMANTHTEWASSVEAVSVAKLNLPLLKVTAKPVAAPSGDAPSSTAKSQQLAVNFDGELARALREVYYLEAINSFNTSDNKRGGALHETIHSGMGGESEFSVPSQLQSIFEKREILRTQMLSMEHVCTTYNSFMASLRDEEEKPLLREELADFLRVIERGANEIVWTDTDVVNAFVAEAVRKVNAIDLAVTTLHSNVHAIELSMEDFIKDDKLFPFSAARGDKTLSETELRKLIDDTIKKRTALLKSKGDDFHGLLNQSLEAVNALKVSTESEAIATGDARWKTYVGYVDTVLRGLLVKTVTNSLQNLRKQLDTAWMDKGNGLPIIEVKLALPKVRDIPGRYSDPRFEPLLGALSGMPFTSPDATAEPVVEERSVHSLITNTVKETCGMCAAISAFVEDGQSYSDVVSNHPSVQALVTEIDTTVGDTTQACKELCDRFNEFQSLWVSDMKQSFTEFLEKGTVKRRRSSYLEEDLSKEVPQTKQEYFGASLADFDRAISEFERISARIENIEDRHRVGFVRVDVKPIHHALRDLCRRWKGTYTGYLTSRIKSDLDALYAFIDEADKGLDVEVLDGNIESLKSVMRWIRDCRKRHEEVMGDETLREPNGGPASGMFPPIQSALQLLKNHALVSTDADAELQRIEELDELRKPALDMWQNTNKKALNVRAQNSVVQDREAEKVKETVVKYEQEAKDESDKFHKHRMFTYKNDRDEIYSQLNQIYVHFMDIDVKCKELRDLQELFDLTPSQFKEVRECRHDLMLLKQVWDLNAHVMSQFSDWMKSTFQNADVAMFEDECKKLAKQLQQQPIRVKGWECFKGVEEQVRNMRTSLPLCDSLGSPAMRPRHWDQLVVTTKQSNPIDPAAQDFTLEKLFALGLHNYSDDVGNIVEKAEKELRIEKNLNKIIEVWEKLKYTYEYNEELKTYLLGPVEEIVEQLENDNNALSSMLSDRFVEYFYDKVFQWQKNLGMVDTCTTKWMDLQRQWTNLYPIFVLSEDIKVQLPEDAQNFLKADEVFRLLMSKAHRHENIVEAVCSDKLTGDVGRGEDLDATLTFIQDILNNCEKALSEYLETKRKIFPRFFFVSSTDLIDILSKGSNPAAVMVHMSKIIDSVETFRLDNNPNPNCGEKDVWEMVSIQGEHVALDGQFTCDGPVEVWLNGCISAMQRSIRMHIKDANASYIEKPRTEWIYNHPCQAIIVASRIWFTAEMHQAFTQIEEGNDMGMKDCVKNQKSQLDALIKEVLLDRTSNDRKMLVHLITIDVHNRDIVQTMVDERVDAVDSFTWQSQLRYYWDEARGSDLRIADAEFINGYEYIGLCGCLVITKLTDRCYITLTQALRLNKGGAPAGPAGTGKTETTKDLARNMGIACYVFNCSDQMNYISLGQIFKGLAMSGSWGCFDEFNRISIEVLSVVATQVGSILNALKEQRQRFRFMDEEISIIPSVGMWITMNPGYAGRTELPENIKSLFRPCAMCVPDLKNICEIMLAAEGFGDAKDLALKFVTLYRLNRELLSPQDHYDWGLRAVKSVLYIAGALKRGDPGTPERNVLMRALRDTNMAKLSKDDVYVFMGLIRSLFPNLDVPKKDKPDLVAACKEVCKEQGNLPGEEDIFILKCVQYEELLHVRHSVFVLGPAGSGKTECWKCLQGAITKLNFDTWKAKAVSSCLNPKAITSNELYGYFTPNKEWRDGILSCIFRDFATESKKKKNMKWIVLDGIIDAEWIESMNTVMDDNKMLTLVSNERIPLADSMRMIFEISHLRNASPATVSRAGVVFINDTDLGWGPFKDKWIASREKRERTILDSLFDKYVPLVFDFWKRGLKTVVTLVDINVVQTICFLLEGIFTPAFVEELANHPGQFEVYEKYFAFAVVWAFGGPLPGTDGRIDMRQNFSNIWRKEFPGMKMSDVGTVFDFFVEKQKDESGQATFEWKPWSDLVQPYEPAGETSLSSVTVQTADTVRMSHIMSLFVDNGRSVMLVGTAGTGKTNLIMSKLRSMNGESVLFRVVAFNARTSSNGLQTVMEQSLEKRSGRTYGPPNRKKMVFFMDDMNMPAPDKYGTQEAIALIQQHVNYGYWYDRIKILQKEIVDVRYVGAMNPKSGAFTILDRLLRHFAVFSTNMPDKADLVNIYGQILQAHVKPFPRDIREGLVTIITNATIELHAAVSKSFFPTAVKFHYQWNMREMFNIFQGLCKSNAKMHGKPLQFVRLWIHECSRTFRDRMSEPDDMSRYDTILLETINRAGFTDIDVKEAIAEPLLWAPFYTSPEGEENVYNEITMEAAQTFLMKKLAEYNENYAMMDLVLFNQATEHICRIARITSNPRGNALLVGVGGSGKQSLARLASFINGHDIYQILVTSSYGIADFRTDMQELYRKCGLRGYPFAFIITDSQIVNGDMLVYLNDMLSSGNVPDLFNQDERDGVIGSITNEVKATGVSDYSNPDICWEFFINKVRTNLHIILSFSPVSKNFAVWCRQFPALANTTVIDWFLPWPEQALKSVARRFLSEIELGGPQMTSNVADFMAFCQERITQACEEYYAQEKRRAYTTPKSFLELIALYKELMAKKRSELADKTNRLVSGIQKIKEASVQVADLQEVLQRESVEVEEARRKTGALMETVGHEKGIVGEQSAIAAKEEEKTNKIVAEVEEFESQCTADLAKAQPLVQEALSALDTLDKASISELKNLGKPPDDVQMVAICVKVLTSNPKAIPPPKSRTWAEAKKMMNQVDRFLVELRNFDVNNISQACIDQIQPYISNPAFNPENIKSKSAAAAGLCQWAIGINKYHLVRCDVRPKEERLAEAQERLQQSKTALKKIQDKVAELNKKLDALITQYDDAVATSNAIEAKAKKTQTKMDLAQRLVAGLADESVRWEKMINEFNHQATLLVGDVLLGASFVSYIGPFSKAFRERIITEDWIPQVKELGIPMTENLDIIMQVLTTEAAVASWNNEGLPTDKVSTENGAIVTNCTRWPLMIDPQLQGIRWIRTREEKNGLKVLQTSQKTWQRTLQHCIEEGLPCLLEGLGEFIEPVLDGVLSRQTFKKGGHMYIKMGATEVEYNSKFRLFLQTKLGNPHYGPEINAQTTLINFMVTEAGLEDQLLAVVVNHERPDLENKRVTLLRQMNTMTIELQQCEDGLLYELTNATGDILENVALVENLEMTKKKAKEINHSFALAVTTQKDIATNRLTYTTVAARGSLLFFQIDQLWRIDHMYQYSLEAFMVVFNRALAKAPQPQNRHDVPARVSNVEASITQSVFAYVTRGLFERHKLIFSSLLTFAILTRSRSIDHKKLDFLLRGKKKLGVARPETVAEWCPEPNWAAVQALAEVEGSTPEFSLLPTDMAEHTRWRQWAELEKPEEEKMPTDWKNLTQFERLLVLRCLRPDRLTAALEDFVSTSLGKFFVSDQAVDVSMSYKSSTTTTPLFFILSPGVDPVRSVEELGRKLGYTYDNERLYNVSLGQGQEIVADRALETCFKKGGWVLLNNIHLVDKWLGSLERRLEQYSEVYTRMMQVARRRAEKRAALQNPSAGAEGGGEDAAASNAQSRRQSAVPEGEAKDGGEAGANEGGEKKAESAHGSQDGASDEDKNSENGSEGDADIYGWNDVVDENDDDPETKFEGPRGHPEFRVFLSAEPSNVIPIGILQRSIKLTSEPPSGIRPNVARAMACFSDEPWERSAKPSEYRCIMFSMCFFHSVVVERKKFGPQGWNRVYPFNLGDLTTCMEVTQNYIEDRPKIPWEDLRYVFGEIMYGGHITDDWDRVLCMAYLKTFIVPECCDGMQLVPGLAVPQPMGFSEYMDWISNSTEFPNESPVLFGLHPNAEINYRTVQADVLFNTINDLQPKQTGGADVLTPQEIVEQKIEDIRGRLPEPYNLQDIAERLEEDRSPQQHVFYQECERMNVLIDSLQRTLEELDLGLKGALSMTSAMQQLFDSMFMDKLPEVWTKVSFMSMRSLGSWVDNFLSRNEQLTNWMGDLQTPKVTNISYFFNPMSFLTAIMQTTSMTNNFDLDQMSLVVDVLKKSPDQIESSARDGCHVFGLCMEGARWDSTAGCIEESRMKELYPRMPVMTVRSLPLNKVDRRDQYECPVYKTQQRGPGYVVGFFLKTKQPPQKWTIAGTALLLDVVE